jgi:hypothetical protein
MERREVVIINLTGPPAATATPCSLSLSLLPDSSCAAWDPHWSLVVVVCGRCLVGPPAQSWCS